VRYKGHSIADVLAMSVDEALDVFHNHRAIRRILETLQAVGLGYIHLGQPSHTLSGGEAQRVKLSRELAKVETGRTLYVLDEPSTGLHFDDVRKLLDVAASLVEAGNTVVMIEHNLDIIKTTDWVVDLGPEGGDRGGRVIAAGPPELVAVTEGSFTGEFLREALAHHASPVIEAPLAAGAANSAEPKRKGRRLRG
jgi:excinuclease ABC subunit A